MREKETRLRPMMKMLPIILFVALCASMQPVSALSAEEAKIIGDPYALNTCIVSNQKLGSMGEPVVINHDGREIKVCCNGCIKLFTKKADEFIQKIDATMVKEQLKYYPLDTCVVAGGKLGGMGEPKNIIYHNRLVRFCCDGCKPQFEKDPDKFIKAMDQAVIKKQLATYPLDTCVVGGAKLGAMGDPVNVVIANRLVRLCCSGCETKLKKDPIAFLSKIEDTKE
jgi:hypothetical protein